MKICFLTLTFLCGFLSYGQEHSMCSAALICQNSNGIRYTDFSKKHEIDMDKMCHKYKRMKLAGGIISGISGALLITGAALLGSANNSTNEYTSEGLYVGGGMCLAVSGCGAVIGLPILIVGAYKTKKYCTAARTHLEFSTNGHNLALNF